MLYIPFLVPAGGCFGWWLWWRRRTWKIDDRGIELYIGKRLRRRLEWSDVMDVRVSRFSTQILALRRRESITIAPVSEQIGRRICCEFDRIQSDERMSSHAASERTREEADHAPEAESASSGVPSEAASD